MREVAGLVRALEDQAQQQRGRLVRALPLQLLLGQLARVDERPRLLRLGRQQDRRVELRVGDVDGLLAGDEAELDAGAAGRLQRHQHDGQLVAATALGDLVGQQIADAEVAMLACLGAQVTGEARLGREQLRGRIGADVRRQLRDERSERGVERRRAQRFELSAEGDGQQAVRDLGIVRQDAERDEPVPHRQTRL